jgi:hypothetical protein
MQSEATMRGLFVRSGGTPRNGQRWGFGVTFLPALLAVLLIAVAMAMIGPPANPWMAGEVLAELSGASYGPPTAPVQADASR